MPELTNKASVVIAVVYPATWRRDRDPQVVVDVDKATLRAVQKGL